MELTYLASPYSVGGADAQERERRFKLACKAAAVLMSRGENIFCPIAHSHPIEVHGMTTIEGHDFWLKQDFAILAKCTKLKIFVIEGVDWSKSIGINKELELAQHIGIPVEYVYDYEVFDA